MRANEMCKRTSIAIISMLLVGCSSTYPNARLAGPSCAATPDTLARVTYEEKSGYIEIGCVGCSKVYVAAQHAWLKKMYPGYRVKEHYTASGFGSDPLPAPLQSCFVLVTRDGREPHVCFADSGWCREKKSPRVDGPHNNLMTTPPGSRLTASYRPRLPAGGCAGG